MMWKSRERLKIDLGTLIERNAAFEPDEPAIHFEVAPLKLTLFRRIRAGARGLKARVDLSTSSSSDFFLPRGCKSNVIIEVERS